MTIIVNPVSSSRVEYENVKSFSYYGKGDGFKGLILYYHQVENPNEWKQPTYIEEHNIQSFWGRE